MLLGHHTYEKTIDEHLRRIAELARDPRTLVFLDTNILSYLYKLNEAARQEFFVWSDAIVAANRLAIPAWVASEYWSRVKSKSLDSYTPKSREPSQAKKALDALYETASLFVDDPLLRRISFAGDRVAYLSGFRQAIDALDVYTRAFSQQFDPGVIHQQIVKHLSPAILDSDLPALCARASHEGDARFEHRLPPGFRDGNKDENRFGDLIIWFEILSKSAASEKAFSEVLFVTNDEKSDWLYVPKMRIEEVAGARKPVGNSVPEIKLADPRLVSEFRRCAKNMDFSICSLATLVEGLSKDSATQFAQLAAAIQINIQEAAPGPPLPLEAAATTTDSAARNIAGTTELLIETVEAADNVSVSLSVRATEPATPRLRYSTEAICDSQYQFDALSEIDAVIRALKSLNWYIQNPAMEKIRSLRNEDFSPSSWFVLGRNIYQAACGNSQKAMGFMAALESQLMQFPRETAQHLLAGMLFEIYFDGHGQFRHTSKFGYADKPLALAALPDYEDVRVFIRFHLHRHHAQLKFLPGNRETIVIHVVSTVVMREKQPAEEVVVWQLQSIKLDGVELICAVANQADSPWKKSLSRSELSQDDLRAEISEELAIPEWALAFQFEPPVPEDAELLLPEGRELQPKRALEEAVRTDR